MEKRKYKFRLEINETHEQFLEKIKSKKGTKDLKPFLAERFINTPAAFDLLCYGRRVSFDFGRLIGASGIFPFQDCDIYFELKETGETLRTEANKKRLPDVEFCKCVYAIRDILNRHLKELGCPILSGSYFAVSDYIYGADCIISFDGDAECMPADYCNNDEKAKIRYIGGLYPRYKRKIKDSLCKKEQKKEQKFAILENIVSDTDEKSRIRY